MIIWIENYSGMAADLDIDGNVYSIPEGRNQINLDESYLMNGEVTVTWDPGGMMIMDSMDADDVLTADSMGNAVFHSLEASQANGSGGTLVPYDTFMSGLGFGGVTAATVMIFLIVKKVLFTGVVYE